MIKNMLQCCYTNASREEGSILTSGWQAVCVSPDFPRDAFSECTRIQNANSTINGIMKDESGNVLNLFEISGDGSYIYILRTQYGLTDRLGRANMFSHAYVLPAKSNENISDPNSFLTIANENFKENEEDAMRLQENLIRLKAFDIRSAMEICGLDKEKMLTLVKSVYAQMTDKKIVKPLFIRYNGDENVLRAMLYCIYSALPFSARKRLSVASVFNENTANMNIVFSVSAGEQEYFCNPATGENSILTERSERRITRLGFLDHAVKNIDTPQLSEYFFRLEEITGSLGDPTGANELLMKIAHSIITTSDKSEYDKKSDSELDILLSDALRSDSLGSSLMDKYIALLLDKVVAKKMVLSNENDISLSNRVKSNVSKELLESVDRYRLYMFNEMPIEKAVIVLENMSDNEMDGFVKKLSETDKGRQTLDHYYSVVELNKNGGSWEGIQRVIVRSKGFKQKPETQKRIIECATALYENSLKVDKVKQIVESYNNYAKTLEMLLGDESEKYAHQAKIDFWKNVGYYNIELDQRDEYSKMYIDTFESSKMMAYCEISQELLKKENFEKFFRNFNIYFSKVKDETSIKVLVNWVKTKFPNLRKDFEIWFEIITYTKDKNDVEYLLELYDLSVIKEETEDNERHDKLTFESGEKKSQLNRVVDTFFDYVECTRDKNKKIIKAVASLITAVCARLETEEDYVDLDTWLRFGNYIDENCFYIFDVVKPIVLSLSEQEVIDNSTYIKESEYIELANEYIKDRGSEYKTVKKWMVYTGEAKPGLFGRFTKLFESGKDQSESKKNK